MELDQPSSTAVLTDEHVGPDDANVQTMVDDGRLVGGVCVLIADRLGLDVLWVRIAFVVMALTGGFGLLVYAGLWLTLVAAPASGWRWVRVAGAAVMIGLVPLLLQAGSFEFMTGPLAVVLLLLGLMLALWNPRRSPAPSRVAPVVSEQGTWWSVPRGDAVATQPPAPLPVTASRPPRRRSLLGRATLGAALMVAAAGALIDLSTGSRLHPEQWLGAAGVVCGVGLLVGVFRGRARWLIVPAVVFALVGFGTGELARMGIGLDDAFGDRYVSIGEGFSGSLSPRTGAGNVYVWIDSAADQTVTIDARAAGGRIAVNAADDVTVLVRARLDNGQLVSDGSVVYEGSGELTVGPEGEPDVIVDAWVGHGDVRIDQFSADQFVAPPAPIETLPPMPGGPDVGALVFVNDWVSATPDGWIVLGGGEAVIDPDDRVVTGQMVDGGGVSPIQVAGSTIATSVGEYRLLPRGLLVLPDQTILDLQAVREGLAPDPADPVETVPELLPAPPVVPSTPASTIGGQP